MKSQRLDRLGLLFCSSLGLLFGCPAFSQEIEDASAVKGALSELKETAKTPEFQEELGYPFEEWLKAKSVEIGFNPNAEVYAARGSAQDRLESLVWAIGDFSEWLGCKIVDAGGKQGDQATKSSSMRSTSRLKGYDIEFMSYITSAGGSERIMVIRKDDRLVCMAHETGQAESIVKRVSSFFPAIDEVRRAAVEKALFTAFVKDSFEHLQKDGESMECVFLIDCKTKGPNE